MPYLHTVVTHWAKLNTEDILRVVMSCVITKHFKNQIRDNIYEFQVIISFEILSVYFIPGENYEPCFHVVTEQWWKYEDYTGDNPYENSVFRTSHPTTGFSENAMKT